MAIDLETLLSPVNAACMVSSFVTQVRKIVTMVYLILHQKLDWHTKYIHSWSLNCNQQENIVNVQQDIKKYSASQQQHSSRSFSNNCRSSFTTLMWTCPTVSCSQCISWVDIVLCRRKIDTYYQMPAPENDLHAETANNEFENFGAQKDDTTACWAVATYCTLLHTGWGQLRLRLKA